MGWFNHQLVLLLLDIFRKKKTSWIRLKHVAGATTSLAEEAHGSVFIGGFGSIWVVPKIGVNPPKMDGLQWKTPI